MLRIVGGLLASSVILAGCGDTDGHSSSEAPAPAMMDAPEGVAMLSAARPHRSERGAPAPAPNAEPQATPGVMLAYSYQTSLELPSEAVATTQSDHVQACTQAGPATCQVIRAQVNNAEGPRPSAYLQVRATPAWITAFRDTLAAQTEAVGGAVMSDQTSVEDLTARIVDTQARVRARTTLRDRLQTLLETRDGDLSDLLAVERELANVQADLDAQASVLAALRQRVDTSLLTLNYQSQRQIVEPETFNPIGDALKEMGNVFAGSLASLILFLAGALPWLVIAVPVISGVIIGFRRLLRRKKPA